MPRGLSPSRHPQRREHRASPVLTCKRGHPGTPDSHRSTSFVHICLCQHRALETPREGELPRGWHWERVSHWSSTHWLPRIPRWEVGVLQRQGCLETPVQNQPRIMNQQEPTPPGLLKAEAKHSCCCAGDPGEVGHSGGTEHWPLLGRLLLPKPQNFLMPKRSSRLSQPWGCN